nr:unnamed protein product [Callosobruchus analis]
MDSLPGIAVASCSSTKPRSLIKLITKNKDILEDPKMPGLIAQTWEISNKYYTAKVKFLGLEMPSDQTNELETNIEALILHMDANKESGLEDLNKWMHLDQSHSFEVKLLLSNYCTEETKITKYQALEWCLKHDFEFIELYPTKKKTGVERVIEALQCYTWPNLILKDKDKPKGEVSCKNTKKTECEDEADDFTELFAQLHMMKDSLQNMPANQRKQCAEQMLKYLVYDRIGSNNKEMDSNDDKVDPDYATNNAALRNLERRDESTVTVETIHRIISEEFDKELTVREKQLEEIEEQIAKAQKLLHLVRYVLVTSYYNKKNLEHTTTAEEQMSTVFDSQNRIHPAVKKLIGKKPILDVFNIHGKRKAAKSSIFGEPSTSQTVEVKKPKLESKGVSKASSVDSNQNCLQSRKKIRHRIVIGNISKYMSTTEDDSMTHKWMVYVRGENNKPDISDIVKKVVFYLHPSYRPNDVVEVNESPFHLSRRGWGEFPLRVQIFFKNSLNKPVDIVHNLKLDKSCTGRQVLGNETLVDVYLRDSSPASKTKLKTESADIKIKQEPFNCQESTEVPSSSSTANVKVKEESYSEDIIFDLDLTDSSNLEAMFTPLDLDSTNEHSYCNNGMDTSISKDHSYSLASVSDSSSSITVKKESNITEILEQGNNRLIFGLGDNYLGEKKKEVVRKDVTKAKKVSISVIIYTFVIQ